MHSQIAGKSTPRYVSNVGTLWGAVRCRRNAGNAGSGQSLSGLGGNVASRACIVQATFGGGPGNRPIRHTTFAPCARPIAPALDRIRSLFAFGA